MQQCHVMSQIRNCAITRMRSFFFFFFSGGFPKQSVSFFFLFLPHPTKREMPVRKVGRRASKRRKGSRGAARAGKWILRHRRKLAGRCARRAREFRVCVARTRGGFVRSDEKFFFFWFAPAGKKRKFMSHKNAKKKKKKKESAGFFFKSKERPFLCLSLFFFSASRGREKSDLPYFFIFIFIFGAH